MITRRGFLLATVSSTLALLSRTPAAQTRQKPVTLGYLTLAPIGPSFAAFKEGMAAHGWKEGVHYVLEARSAEGRFEHLPQLAKELAAVKPAVLVGTTALATRALTTAAPTIPVVQASGTNPVESGLAASFARPGGMVTGLTSLPTEVSEKLVEVVSAIEPKVKRIGFFVARNLKQEASRDQLEAARRATGRFGMEGHYAHPGTAEEIERTLAAFAAKGVQVLVAMPSPYFPSERPRILRVAQAHRIAVVAAGRQWVERGALLSYAANIAANHRRAAYHVDRILKGAKPGDLPIEQPSEFELAVNLKTAKALGFRIPQPMLLQASRVIE